MSGFPQEDEEYALFHQFLFNTPNKVLYWKYTVGNKSLMQDEFVKSTLQYMFNARESPQTVFGFVTLCVLHIQGCKRKVQLCSVNFDQRDLCKTIVGLFWMVQFKFSAIRCLYLVYRNDLIYNKPLLNAVQNLKYHLICSFMLANIIELQKSALHQLDPALARHVTLKLNHFTN